MDSMMSASVFAAEEPGIPAMPQGIPASLAKVVQLASTITGASVSGFVEDAEAGSSPAGWSTPDSPQDTYHDSFDPTNPAMWEHVRPAQYFPVLKFLGTSRFN